MMATWGRVWQVDRFGHMGLDILAPVAYGGHMQVSNARYGDRLSTVIAATPGASGRGLATKLRPHNPEPMRRLLRRYVTGERTPGPTVKAEILAALREMGADTRPLEIDDDEEVAALYRDLHDLAAMVDSIRSRLPKLPDRDGVAA